MLGSIGKWKIWAAVAGIMLIMWNIIKRLLAKNAQLEHNEEVREEIDEIEVKQKTDRSEALENEKQTIKKRVKNNSSKSRRDRARSL